MNMATTAKKQVVTGTSGKTEGIGVTAGAKVVVGQMITAPEFRGGPENRVYLLGFVDKNGNQQHLPTSRELYLYAAGKNQEGEKPDGLDLLTEHSFHVYVTDGTAVALDIIPTRMLRSGFTYTAQAEVENLTVRVLLKGRVLRVAPMERPPGMLASQMRSLFRGIRKAAAVKPLEAGDNLPSIGTIESVDAAKIVIAPHRAASTGRPMYDVDPASEA